MGKAKERNLLKALNPTIEWAMRVDAMKDKQILVYLERLNSQIGLRKSA